MISLAICCLRVEGSSSKIICSLAPLKFSQWYWCGSSWFAQPLRFLAAHENRHCCILRSCKHPYLIECRDAIRKVAGEAAVNHVLVQSVHLVASVTTRLYSDKGGRSPATVCVVVEF